MGGFTSSYSTPGNSDDNNGELVNQNVGENVQEQKDEAEDSDREKIKNPFEMVDTVSLLVKYLDGKSLKSSLMVSKLWNTEGMKLCFKNNFIKVPKKLTFETVVEKNETIHELEASFISSNKFSKAVIKTPRDIEILKQHNVLVGLSHVKMDLEFRGSHDNEINCVEKVLEECPNLTFLENLSSYDVIKKCVELEKNESLTLSNLTIKFNDSEDSFQTIEKFINSGVKVVDLRLNVEAGVDGNLTIQVPDMIQKILHSSKDCLKNLDSSDCLLPMVDNVPVMSQLESFKMKIETPRTPGIPMAFPIGFRFDKNCPNLKSFKVSCTAFEDDVWEENYLDEIFTKTGPASSVKHLDVRFSGQFPLNHLCQTFRETETLRLSWDSLMDFKPVWNFCRHLKILSFSIDEFEVWDFVELLTQMTGYSKEHIKSNVWNSSNVKISPLVGQPSLLDLQDLEEFIIWGYVSRDVTKEEISKFLSLVRDFAFPNMPKLKKVDSEKC